MNEDRRASRRAEVRLPFQWRLLTGTDTLSAELQRWKLQSILQRQHRQADLEGEFEQATRAVADPAAVAALRALSARLELLEAMPLDESSEPPRQRLELSAEGIGFWSGQRLNEGDRLAIHMILPGGYHLTSEATVSRVRSQEGRFRVGASLGELDSVSARRLTRLIIS
jgi:hypothetical protein